MPHEEQNEWPSFETVLRDVAPDSPKARLLASAADRARYAASAESVRASEIDASNNTSSLAQTPIEPNVGAAVAVPVAYTALPAPLEPLEIDTSEVRALLEHRTEPIPQGDTLSALAELAPWPELEVEAPRTLTSEPVVADDNEPEPLADHNDLFALIADDNEPEPLADHNDLFALVEDDNESINDIELASTEVAIEDVATESIADTLVYDDAVTGDLPFDDSLVFELDNVSIEELDAAYEATVAEQPAPLDDPFIDAGPFSIDDVPDTASSEHGPPIESIDDTLDSDPFGLDAFSSVGGSLDAFPAVHNSFDGASIDLSNDELAQEENIDSDDQFAEADLSGSFDVGGVIEEAETPVVDVEDLEVKDLDTFELPSGVAEAEGIELPGQISPPIEVFEDLAPIGFAGDQLENAEEINLDPELLDMSAVDRIDMSGLPSTNANDGFFETPGMDLFDLNVDSNSIETGFDSVAAADEIETDLDELIGLKSDIEPNNVIPLHSGIDVPTAEVDINEHSAGAKNLSVDATHSGWVGLTPQPIESSEPDPWQHMRPVEETRKTGFWANRPKFFGGDDRKRRKAERRSEDVPSPAQAVDVTFETECPNCSTECNVELDDPIGRRVHLTCPSCQHIWYTPYILEESQAV